MKLDNNFLRVLIYLKIYLYNNNIDNIDKIFNIFYI